MVKLKSGLELHANKTTALNISDKNEKGTPRGVRSFSQNKFLERFRSKSIYCDGRVHRFTNQTDSYLDRLSFVFTNEQYYMPIYNLRH